MTGEIVEPPGLWVTLAAGAPGVTRPALLAVPNERAALAEDGARDRAGAGPSLPRPARRCRDRVPASPGRERSWRPSAPAAVMGGHPPPGRRSGDMLPIAAERNPAKRCTVSDSIVFQAPHAAPGGPNSLARVAASGYISVQGLGISRSTEGS